ncbi:MAG: class IV adenylate cyclase [Chloroflexota bacterium]
METETEAKFYVRNLAAVQLQLEKMGAHLLQPRALETNLRFDLPDGSLRQGGRVLRLRLRRDGSARLTCKGQSEVVEGVQSRPEIEVEVGDFDATRRLLESLGYRVVATYEKYRQVYSLEFKDGNLHVFLDELPYGDFVEIEGETVEAVIAAAKRLGLDPQAAIPAGYLVLFEALSAERGYDPSKLTFTALAGLSPQPEHLHVRAADK